MPEVEWEYPSLADYQREWIADQHRFVAIEGATGTGKTHVYEPYLFQEAHAPVSIFMTNCSLYVVVIGTLTKIRLAEG